MRSPRDLFLHCPRCTTLAVQRDPVARPNPFVCASCNLTYFFNPTVSAAAFIRDHFDRVLFIRRAHDPARGKLAVPGGFIDIGESAEEGLCREVREEVGLEIKSIEYLGSRINDYPYKEVVYPVVDLIFTARALRPESAQALDAVAGIVWRDVREIDPEEFAFPSMRLGYDKLLSRVNEV